MNIIKYYETKQIRQWLKEAGINNKQANLFLKLFQYWSKTSEDLSIFNYSFLSGSFSTETRNINDDYVIKCTSFGTVKSLQRKIDCLIKNNNIDTNIFLPIYCLKLNNNHCFSNEFIDFQQKYSEKCKISRNLPKHFDCLIIQRKVITLEESVNKLKAINNLHFDVNYRNLGILDSKLVLFDW